MTRNFAILAAAAAGLLATVPVRAQDTGMAADIEAATTPVKHVLVSTFIDEGPVKLGGLNKGGLIYVFTNPVAFTCTAACTLQVEVMEQVGANKTAKNLWDICAFVDGKTDGFLCLYQGTLPTDSSYVVGNYAWSVPLTKGAHTAEPTVFVTAPAVITDFYISYHVYQP